MFSFGDTKDNLGDTSLLAAAYWITGVAELLLLLPPCRNSDDNSVPGLANLPVTSSTLSSVDILIFEFALCKIWFTVVRNVGWFNIFLTSRSILLPSCGTLLSAISLFGGSSHSCRLCQGVRVLWLKFQNLSEPKAWFKKVFCACTLRSFFKFGRSFFKN